VVASIQDLKQSPNYQKYSPKEKEEAELYFTNKAWQEHKSDNSSLAFSTDEKQEADRAEFNKAFPKGPQVQVEDVNKDKSYFGEVMQQFGYGSKDAANSTKLLDNVITGNSDDGTAQHLFNEFEEAKTRNDPESLQRAAEYAQVVAKDWDSANTWWGKAIQATTMPFKAVKHTVQNPKGAGLLFANSFPNMVAPLLATKAAQVAGAAAGIESGPGLIATGIAAGVSTSAAMESTPRLKQLIIEQTQYDNDGVVTPENIQRTLDDKELMSGLNSQARGFGVTHGLVDTGLNFVGGRIGSSAVKVAERAAAKALTAAGELSEAGVKTLSKEILNSRGLATKAAETAGRLGIAAVEEPLGEAAAQQVSSGKVDVADVFMEAVGGVAGSGIHSAINKSVYGTKQLAKGKDILQTPADLESVNALRAMAKEAGLPNMEPRKTTAAEMLVTTAKNTPGAIMDAGKAIADTTSKVVDTVKNLKTPAEEKRLFNLANPERLSTFKPALKDAVDRQDVEHLTDPSNKTYSPVTAVMALNQINNSKETLPVDKAVNREKANETFQAYRAERNAHALAIQEFIKLDDYDVEESKRMGTKLTLMDAVMDKMVPHVDALNAPDVDPASILKQSESITTDSSDDDVKSTILAVYGSKGGATLNDHKALDAIEVNEKAAPELRDIITKAKDYNKAEAALLNTKATTQNKDTKEVHNDVITGSAGFKGTRTYLSNISTYITAGSTVKANAEFDKLVKFTEDHTAKADLFARVQDSTIRKTALSEADTAAMAVHNKIRTDKGLPAYTLGKNAFSIINNLKLEAHALTQAVAFAGTLTGNTAAIGGSRNEVQAGLRNDVLSESVDGAIPSTTETEATTTSSTQGNTGTVVTQGEEGLPGYTGLPKTADTGKKVLDTSTTPLASVKDYYKYGLATMDSLINAEKDPVKLEVLSRAATTIRRIKDTLALSEFKVDTKGKPTTETFIKLKDILSAELNRSTDKGNKQYYRDAIEMLGAKIADKGLNSPVGADPILPPTSSTDASKTGLQSSVKDYYAHSPDALNSLLSTEIDPKKKDTITRAITAVGYIKASLAANTSNDYTAVKAATVIKLEKPGLSAKAIGTYKDAIGMLDAKIADTSLKPLVKSKPIVPPSLEANAPKTEVKPLPTANPEPEQKAFTHANSHIDPESRKKQSFTAYGNAEQVVGTYFKDPTIHPDMEMMFHQDNKKNWHAYELSTGVKLNTPKAVKTAKGLKEHLKSVGATSWVLFDNQIKAHKAKLAPASNNTPSASDTSAPQGVTKKKVDPVIEPSKEDIDPVTTSNTDDQNIARYDAERVLKSINKKVSILQGKLDKLTSDHAALKQRTRVPAGKLARQSSDISNITKAIAKLSALKAGHTALLDSTQEHIPFGTKLSTVIEEDTTNKVRNHTQPTPQKRGVGTLLQKTDNLLSVLNRKSLTKLVNLFNKEHVYDDDADRLVSSLNHFTEAFTDTFNRIFKDKSKDYNDKTKDFRNEDAIHYLLEDGKMPANVINAMAGVAYQWLASRSSETVRLDTNTLLKVLGITRDEDTVISSTAHRLLGDKGVSETLLTETLGPQVFKLLGVDFKGTADLDIQEMLENSLALQTLAIMEEMQLVTPTKILVGNGTVTDKQGVTTSVAKGFVGLKELVQGKPGDYSQINEGFVFKATKSKEDEGKSTITFYRVKVKDNNLDPLVKDNFVDPYRMSKNTWERIYQGEDSTTDYTFKQPRLVEEGKQAKLKRANAVATVEQTANKNASERKPYNASARSMNFYLMLPVAVLDKIQGRLKIEDHLAKNKESIEGTNFGFDRINEAIQSWLNAASKQPDGYASKFYIPAVFWKQLRMGQEGSISPQGDKAARALFNMSEIETTVDMADTDTLDMFKEAIAISMDIEHTKEGGLQPAIDKLTKLMETPVLVKAIKAVQDIIAQEGSFDFNTLDPDRVELLGSKYVTELDALADGAVEGKLNFRSMKAIIEYARFLTAKANGDTKFDTDAITEIDGVANGPTILRLMFMSAKANVAQTLASLQSSGIAFFNEQVGLAQHLIGGHDAYMSVGFEWAGKLVDRMGYMLDTYLHRNDKLVEGEDPITLKDITNAQAVENIFGSFFDENGVIKRLVRTLSKDPTMKTGYGMGNAAMLRDLGDTAITMIDDKVTAIANAGDTEQANAIVELDNLDRDIFSLTGIHVFPGTSVLNGSINKSELLKYTLPLSAEADIREAVARYHGDSLAQAIDTVYGTIKDAMKPVNAGIVIAAAKYNTAYKMLLKQAKDVAAKDKRKITIDEHKAILSKIVNMLPSLTTVSGGKMPIAAMDKTKNYGDKGTNKDGITSTTQQRYNGPMDVKRVVNKNNLGLSSPRAKGPVLGTQMVDGFVANAISAVADVVNNHDGFTTGVGTVRELANKTNKIFFDGISKYDMVRELYNVTTGVEKAFLNFVAKQSANSNINKSLSTELISMDVKSFYLDGKKLYMSPTTVGQYLELINKQFSKVAVDTTNNKALLVKAMTGMGQYSFPGGEYATGNVAQDSITINEQTIKPSNINPVKKDYIDTRSAEYVTQQQKVGELLQEFSVKQLEETESLLKEAQASGNIEQYYEAYEGYNNQASAASLSTNPDDYKVSQLVDRMNVVDVYDNIKGDSTKQDSPEHDAKLRGLLVSLIRPVLQPIQLYLASNSNRETEGKFVAVGNGPDRVFISNQSDMIGPVPGALMQGIRMSTGETYVHETLHAVLHTGFSLNKALNDKVGVLYRIAFKQLGDDGYKAFLNDPDMDITDPANQYEVQAAITRYNTLFRDPAVNKNAILDPVTGLTNDHNISTHLDEFANLVLSNENFGKACSNIKLNQSNFHNSTWKGIRGNNIQDTIVNIGNAIMDFLFNKFSSKNVSRDVHSEIVSLAHQLTKTQNKHKTVAASILIKTGAFSKRVSSMGNNSIKHVLTRWPVIKVASQLKSTVALVHGSNTLLGQKMRDVGLHINAMENGMLVSAAKEIRGKTPRMERIYALANMRRTSVDSIKQAEAEATIEMVNGFFKEPLPETTKASITRSGVMVDTVALLDHMGIAAIGTVLKDSKERNLQISKLLNALRADKELRPWATYYERSCNALGLFMAQGVTLESTDPFLNIRAIAELIETKASSKISAEAAKRAAPLLDRLATLYGIEHTGSSHNYSLAKLIEEQPDAVTQVFRYHQVIKDMAVSENFWGDSYQVIKGYTKQITNPRIVLEYGTLDQEADFVIRGYSRASTPMPSSGTGKPVYRYINRNGKPNDWRAGVLSMRRTAAKGTSVMDLPGLERSDALKHLAALKNAKAAIREKMFDPSYRPKPIVGNQLIAKLNDLGKIVDYRQEMSEQTRAGLLEKNYSFDKIFGSMSSQIIDKVASPAMNRKLVTYLQEEYQDNYKANPASFVRINDNSTDLHIRHIARMIPAQTRKDIHTVWGSGNDMYVPKDMLNIAFGYRDYTIENAFLADPKSRSYTEKAIVSLFNLFGESKGMARALAVEDIAMELAKLSKDTIVVKSLELTFRNMGSNMMYLRSRGVYTHDIVRGSWIAVTQGIKYQAGAKELIKLKKAKQMIELEPRSRSRLDKLAENKLAITMLEDKLARNPTKVVIEAGGMPTLVDDINTVAGTELYPSKTSAFLTRQTNKLPSLVQKAGKHALMIHGTSAYAFANNAVKMTDFMARYVLYNHYVHGEKIKTHEEAMAAVTEEFIDFTIPTHRITEYLNKIGLLRFTKYGLRVLKPIATSATDRPFDAAMAVLTSGFLGWDNVFGSIPFVTKNPLSMIGGVLDAPKSVSQIGILNALFK